MNVDQWLEAIPPLLVYLIVGGVITTESLGIPLPGEIALAGAALLASQHHELNPIWVGVAATAGAIVGDSIGYLIGKKGGKRLLAWAGRRFPKHFGPKHIAKAERMFAKYGMWAVFFGRFVALLRILSGPLAGSLRMQYPRFLIANALGGIAWAGGTTALIYYLGVAADKWLKGFSWAGLGLAILVGLVVALIMKRKMAQHEDEEDAEDAEASKSDGDTALPADTQR
ncbi:MAG TPA: DedA family protein [Mycobacteriales bacterium]|jgi:membrane protein DedA with SNARE-associated domain|nr:DedA family protein [Mycobacteriales bacterium]